ncbi:MICOS complex subunit MIC19 isoform X3 [Sigmodon hispidus]
MYFCIHDSVGTEAGAMGGTTSTCQVTFQADKNKSITVMKGIWLSENMIDQMKESSPSGSKSQWYGIPVFMVLQCLMKN